MTEQALVWTVPYLLAALLGLWGTFGALRKGGRGSFALAGMLLSAAVATAAHGLSLAVQGLAEKTLFARLEFLLLSATPIFWFYLALAAGSRRPERTEAAPPSRASVTDAPLKHLVWIVPVLTLVFAGSLTLRSWVWAARLTPEGASFEEVRFVLGWWGTVQILFGLLLIGWSTLHLIERLSERPSARAQLLAAAGAPLLVLGGYTLRLLAPEPLAWPDPTSVGYLLAAFNLEWGFLRSRALDPAAIGRKTLFEQLEDAVVVLDPADRIVDLNTSAARLAEAEPGALLDRPLREAFPAAVVEVATRIPAGEEGIDLTVRGENRSYQVLITPLGIRGDPQSSRGRISGRILRIHDDTTRRRNELALHSLTESLSRANSELERLANTDALTGLPNRRRLLQSMQTEILRAKRYERPLAVLLLDIDRFKSVNDRFGHEMGDEVLKATAEVLQNLKRESDAAGRLGGEEFCLVLPETSLEGAMGVAERIRERIAERIHKTQSGTEFNVTTSVGVSVLEPDDEPDDLLRRADAGLYEAKREGRDQVRFVEE